MALIIPILIINVLVFSHFNTTLINYRESAHTGLFNQLKNEFEINTLNAQTIYNSLYANPDADYFFSRDSVYNDNIVSLSMSAASIHDILKNLIISSSKVDSIYLYNHAAEYVLSTSGSAELGEFSDKGWYDIYLQNDMTNCVMSRTHPEKGPVLTLCYNFTKNKELLGTIVVNALLSQNAAFAENSSVCGIADKNGSIIQCSDMSLLNTSVYDFKEFSQVNRFLSADLYTYTHGNSMLSAAISENMEYIYFIKTSDLYTSPENIKFFLLIAAVIAGTVGLAFLIALFFATKFYKNVAEVLSYMDNPTSEKNERRIKSNEFSRIIANVINDSQSDEEINHEISNQLTLLKKAKITALQSQITPHFLFNTLQAINASVISIIKRDNDATRMIVLFSNILETALDSENYLIPLSRELSYASDYMDLLNYRYNRKFIAHWDIPDSVRSYSFLKLSLQPILENAAIYNGIADPEKVEITISASCDKDTLTVSVSNTGVPISQQKIEELTKIFNDTESIRTKKHIGLANTNQRIKLIFGNEYGCEIKVVNGCTTVSIKMPKIKNI